MILYKLAEKFGWTPQQIGEMDPNLIDTFITFMNIESQFKSGDAT